MPTAADPQLFRGMLDDAAIFPPGLKPLEQAVPAHRNHRRSKYRELVGPLVLTSAALDELPRLTRGYADGSVEVSVTGVEVTRAPEVAEICFTLAAVRLAAFELLIGELAPGEVGRHVAELAAVLPGVELFLEVPRTPDGGYSEEVLEALAGTPCRAKFRTGGVTADLYPSEQQLAAAIESAVRLGVPFKATAGLHHALRNTDGDREQHGFANLLWATAEAQRAGDVAGALAERDGAVVTERVAELDPGVRQAFRSFGTCSIDEPVEELRGLGLL
ncbi:hypothetical protein HJ590_10935 [Naumannella sp. ID2617S]|nr:hypothetical protein [Naumannella sp. ID2617S]